MDKSVSYRRNRDYSKSFAWTYELNKDLYKCYVKATEVPKIGYMNRLKEYWVEIHLELNYFSSKSLRYHVISIIKRNVTMETIFNIENRTIESNTEAKNIDENCSAASKITFGIMISITITIETILSGTYASKRPTKKHVH